MNPKGIHCPKCKAAGTLVVATRHPCPGLTVRYRHCPACDGRFATKEVIDPARSPAAVGRAPAAEPTPALAA